MHDSRYDRDGVADAIAREVAEDVDLLDANRHVRAIGADGLPPAIRDRLADVAITGSPSAKEIAAGL
jgi:hypothetical protein